MRSRSPTQRSGITAVLAMLYLSLFTTLAIGFYATVSTSVQVAKNQQHLGRALLASESGMNFMKFHLANLGIPGNTPQDQLFAKAYQSLQTRLNGYGNLGAQTISMNAAQDTITIPTITIDGGGAKFSAVLTKQQAGQQIRCKVVGKYAAVVTQKATQLDYSVAKDAAMIFNYGVASKSAITMNGNVTIQGTSGNAAWGSVLSTTTSTNVPLTMIGSAIISGDVSFTNASATPSISSNATIAGLHPTQQAFSSHVHKGVSDVPFPTIDTTGFATFVPGPTDTGAQVITTSNPSGTTFTNIRIKANANPSFNANTTIQGVVYVETPNKISFGGGLNLTGVVVVQTDGNSNATLDPAVNTIKFSGNVNYQGVNQLPTNDPTNFPDTLRAMTGSMLLAPGFGVTFSGNVGTVGGSLVSSQFTFNGNSGGTITGSVVNMADKPLGFSGTSDIIIQSAGTANYPAGVFFGDHFAPLPKTYAEVLP